MKTDSLFYRLFQRAPALVFELAGLEIPAAGTYQFRAEEIKQTAFRLDGLLVPPPEQPDGPVVFVEMQAQPDPEFYGRFFAELLSGMICYIGYLMVLSDKEERRTLHDRICNTRVVYK